MREKEIEEMNEEDHRRPWTARLDDEARVAKIVDADNCVVANIQDVLRDRALATAYMICRIVNERDGLASALFTLKNKKADTYPQTQKPPLGLRPRFVVVQHRSQEILDAMQRYVESGMEVPAEWREELDGLLDDAKMWQKHPGAAKS